MASIEVIFLLILSHISFAVSLLYIVDEGLPIGHPIGEIARDADLSKQQQQHGTLKFNLLPHRYVHTNLFSIEEDTSELRTAAEIDREELCGIITPCVLDIVVGVLSKTGNFFQVVPVQVRVRDVNDNAPVFPQPVLKVLIPESALPGMYYNVPRAIDLDIANNSIEKYELLTESNLFSLHTSRNADSTVDVSIVLNGTLDREKSAYYQLHLLAMDGGSPPKTGTATINVTVTDINDHKPQFTKSSYTSSHPENTPVGSVLLQVQAVDFDYGLNGKVTYFFGLHTNKDTLRVLSINNTSGEIKLKNPMDYETKKQYQCIVGATDHGSQPQTTQTTVVISAEDINDNTPTLHFNLLSGGDHAMLAENSGKGSFIAHLSVADGDSGDNGKVNCKITTPGFELHQLLANEYKVLLNRSLDRETESEHKISILCQDEGTPQLEGTAYIPLKVSDQNDNAPVFSPAKYAAELYENNQAGEFIAQVSATDSDSGENSQVSFTLASHHELFQIENDSGIITANGGLDRERVALVELLVVAFDHGHPALSSTATVSIRLLDQNDEKPRFLEKNYHLYILEDELPGSLVGLVQALDRDAGHNGEVTYSLLKTPAMDIPFLLDPKSGALKTERALDRETRDSYFFIVAATDNGKGEQHYSMVNVTVHVADANDNFPEFSYPDQLNNTKVIYHTDYVGTMIAKLHAEDKDRGENATIEYRITGGNSRKLFQIHPTTGEMFVVNDMEESDIGKHYLSVSASDNGQPPKVQLTQFVIDVHYGNETYLVPSSATEEEESGVNNLVIGITIALTTVLLAVIMTVVIILVKRKSKPSNPFPRAESQHMMAYGDNAFVAPSPHREIPTPVAMPRPGDVCRQSAFSLSTESAPSLPNNTFTTFKGENSMSTIDQQSMQKPKACSSMLTVTAHSPSKVETVLAPSPSPETFPIRVVSPNRASVRGTTPSPKRWSTGPHNSTYTIIQAADPHRHDDHSDVSGEITNSDSGRGGSEEELPHPVLHPRLDNIRSPTRTCSKPKKRVQLVDPVLTEEPNIHQRVKKWMAEHNPESAYYQINVDSQGNYPLPVDSAHVAPSAKSPPQTGYMPPSILKNSPRHRTYQQTSPSRRDSDINSPGNSSTVAPPKSYDYYSGGVAYRPRAGLDNESDIMSDSFRDDDDGETTTSGSYVINADDLYNEINDLFFKDTPRPVEI